jgi:DNA polymerase-1
VFGWSIRVGPEINPRSLRNFPMQANGAEMLRLVCCLATERGIRVCAPIHDAILIEAPLDDLEATVEATQQAMAEASAIVLDGFSLRSEATMVRYPDRYQDPRGTRMWNTVWTIINETVGKETRA